MEIGVYLIVGRANGMRRRGGFIWTTLFDSFFNISFLR